MSAITIIYAQAVDKTEDTIVYAIPYDIDGETALHMMLEQSKQSYTILTTDWEAETVAQVKVNNTIYDITVTYDSDPNFILGTFNQE